MTKYYKNVLEIINKSSEFLNEIIKSEKISDDYIENTANYCLDRKLFRDMAWHPNKEDSYRDIIFKTVASMTFSYSLRTTKKTLEVLLQGILTHSIENFIDLERACFLKDLFAEEGALSRLECNREMIENWRGKEELMIYGMKNNAPKSFYKYGYVDEKKAKEALDAKDEKRFFEIYMTHKLLKN